ncbi:CdaR family protein [Deltaproteobacteria bacterium TL4]
MTKNLSFKLLALFLAVFVWYLAKQNAEPTEFSFFIPIVFKQLPDGLQITSAPPPLVNVIAHTTKRRKDAFKTSDVQIVLDLHNFTEGRYQYTLTQDNVLAPREVEVEIISPTQVVITTEKVVEKTLEIEPRYHGQLRKGYVLQNIEMLPSKVRVRGPQSIFTALQTIFTTEIDLTDLNSSIDMVVQLDLPDKNLQVMSQNIDFYTARIIVRSRSVKRVFKRIPIYLRNENFISIHNPKTYNLFLEGPEDLIDNLNLPELYGYIDLDDYEPGTYKVEPKTFLPNPEIKILEQWPYVSLWVKSQKVPPGTQNEGVPQPKVEAPKSKVEAPK